MRISEISYLIAIMGLALTIFTTGCNPQPCAELEVRLAWTEAELESADFVIAELQLEIELMSATISTCHEEVAEGYCIANVGLPSPVTRLDFVIGGDATTCHLQGQIAASIRSNDTTVENGIVSFQNVMTAGQPHHLVCDKEAFVIDLTLLKKIRATRSDLP